MGFMATATQSFTQFLLIVSLLGVLTEGSLVIRLNSGLECEPHLPGYFRDARDCSKFYLCPNPSPDYERILQEFQTGVECPQGSIFDENIAACNSLQEVKMIPPECEKYQTGI